MAKNIVQLTNTADTYVLDPSAGPSDIYGLGGNDTITGGPGADTIYGGPGNDVLKGGGGSDGLVGGSGNDTLVPGPGGASLSGGPGTDVAILPGNASNYTMLDYSIDSAMLQNARGTTYNIDPDVETVRFRGGGSYTYADLPNVIAHNGETYGDDTLVAPVSGDAFLDGGPGNDTAVLNGNPSDYTLTRNYESYEKYTTDDEHLGAFVLTANNGSGALSIAQETENVHFQNGQVVPITQLANTIAGNPAYTAGNDQNDILIAGYSGDQYLTGAGGTDAAYIHGNTNDYTIKAVNQPVSDANGVFQNPVNGYELVANNNSGNIYIDNTTESVHFQNGQYLAFGDLTSYIHKAGS